jgi:hypothetical protein
MRISKFFFVVVFALACVACGGGGGGSDNSGPQPQNRAPSANAGADKTASLSASGIELDGSASSDPDGNSIQYSWRVESQPNSASATIDDSSSATATLQTLVPGEYTISLTVTDSAGASSTDNIVLTLTNDAPVISSSASRFMPAVGDNVTLDAAGSNDPNGHSLTYAWEVISSPAASFIKTEFNDVTPIIQFDAEGEYIIELTVSDGYASTTQQLSPFVVTRFAITDLSTPFFHNSASQTGNKLVSVREGTLSIVSLDSIEQHIVTLPQTGTGVSISPNGQRAIVSHANALSLVDLISRQVLATHNVTVDVGDAVLDDNNVAHVFPLTGQWVDIHSVDMTTGTETRNTTSSIRHRTNAKIHPSGQKIYGANTDLSPSDIERYTISGNLITTVYDSPYHGDFPFCGDLWIAADGNSILTKCGVVVRATDNQPTDMTFVMQLDGLAGTIRSASYSPYTDHWYIVDQDGGDASSVKVYDATSGALIREIDLPLSNGMSGSQLLARFVSAEIDNTGVNILTQDHPTNPQNYKLVRSRIADSSSLDLPPSVAVAKYSAGTVNTLITLDASNSYDPEGLALTFDWSLIDEPATSMITPTGMQDEIVQFTPIVAGTYTFEVVVSDGIKQSQPKTITVNVFNDTEPLIYRIEGDVVDAEYSKSLNSMIYTLDNQDVAKILNLNSFSEITIELPRHGKQVGISPDGLFAAVSHAGLASLVDLSTGAVIDTQDFNADWGDIVLDASLNAHLIPRRDQWVQFISLDFENNLTSEVYGPRADTRIRMHPNGRWVYGANRGLSPSDFEKWNVSTSPTQYVGDSPYHGTYPISGNIWISENGTQLLVASGRLFNSSADSAIDMVYLDGLGDSISVQWADHSDETQDWAVIINSTGDPDLSGKVATYRDTVFSRNQIFDIAEMPTSSGLVPMSGRRIFYSEDGSFMSLLIENSSIDDGFAIQITQF